MSIKEEIIVYPNPPNSFVTISSKAFINKIEVNSIDEKLILTKTNIKQENFELDISSFKKGIYILTIETKDRKIITKKLIKN